MKNYIPNTISEYANVFYNSDKPFIYNYSFDDNKNYKLQTLTRQAFLNSACKAAYTLKEKGIYKGDKILHCFGKNNIVDLIFRFGAILIGASPVTVNWQADPLERVLFKFNKSDSKAVVLGESFSKEYKEKLTNLLPDTPFLSLQDIETSKSLDFEEFEKNLTPDSLKQIVFTSGTTGEPKGVELSYNNYKTTLLEFEDMLEFKSNQKITAVLVNPLHHGNSSSFSDMMLRRIDSKIILVEKYTSKYWNILTEITKAHPNDRIIAPAVSRHFEYLENLLHSDKLADDLSPSTLVNALNQIDFIIGSAPVGPTTTKYLEKYTGRIPCVRYGGTETTLQSVGIPSSVSQQQRKEIFEKGWNHETNGVKTPGYYIGRANEPYVQVKIVKSIDKTSPDFMLETQEGEPGYFVAKGENIMLGYVNNPEATDEVMYNNWYLGLKDIGFYLFDKLTQATGLKAEKHDKAPKDFYWMNRDSAMLIRGGANYSYDQINSDLTKFISEEYNLPESSFSVAVVGLKIQSESEDECCVTIQSLTDEAKEKAEEIKSTLIKRTKGKVSRGSHPHYVRFANIPKNFKGAILVNELKKDFEDYLGEQNIL